MKKHNSGKRLVSSKKTSRGQKRYHKKVRLLFSYPSANFFLRYFLFTLFDSYKIRMLINQTRSRQTYMATILDLIKSLVRPYKIPRYVRWGEEENEVKVQLVVVWIPIFFLKTCLSPGKKWSQ